jgi:hypothetical protein
MLPRISRLEEAILSAIEKSSWKTLEIEQLNDKLSRQMISGENATVSQLLLKKGAVVPRHSHVNEQYSWITSGLLKFVFDDREILVGAGEVLVIPAQCAALGRGDGGHRGRRFLRAAPRRLDPQRGFLSPQVGFCLHKPAWKRFGSEHV